MEQLPDSIRKITIELDALCSGSTPGTLEYTLNAHVMRASYDVFIFDEGALRSLVGSFDGRTVELTVRILHLDTKVHQPSSGASPLGGFRNKIHRCEVVSVTEAGGTHK